MDYTQLLKSNIYCVEKDNMGHTIINGTGIVLHTGLGRSPLSKDLLRESFDRIYPYSNLEFNVNKNPK